MDREKAERVYFNCFYLCKVEFRVICQEEVSLGQCGSSEKRNNENLRSEKFEEWFLMHHSIMVALSGTLPHIQNGH